MEPGFDQGTGPALISRAGFERLYWRLIYLIRVSREETARELKRAAAMGRNPRNLELRTARERQNWVEWSIERLKREMALCQVVVSPPPRDGRVHFGSLVRLLDLDRNREDVYRLVGRYESDPARGGLSLDSPLGRAIRGEREGTRLEVETPSGSRTYVILEIVR